MNNKKLGEVYFRDQFGNFHKLSTKDFNEELSQLSNFDSIIKTCEFDSLICNYKPYYYNLLLLENNQNCDIENNILKIEKGLYKFTVSLNIETSYDQNIYFFMRTNSIICDSLQIQKICEKIPNNLSFNFVLSLKCPEEIQIAILSEKKLEQIKSYILYTKLN
jgi:hypothetical protein